jgi:hypothetical protein
MRLSSLVRFFDYGLWPKGTHYSELDRRLTTLEMELENLKQRVENIEGRFPPT